MPKGSNESEAIQTALSRLRDMIRELELDVTRLARRGEGVIDVLKRRDEIEVELRAREQIGHDVRAERTRVDTIDNTLRRRAPQIMSELSQVGGMEGARQRVNPPQDYWWWYTDIQVNDRRRKTAIRTLIAVVMLFVLFGGGSYILDRFFGMSPIEKEASGLISQAEQALYQGQPDKAIPLYEQAITVLPTQPDGYLYLGALYALKGRAADSDKMLTQAKTLIGNELSYTIALARAYEATAQLDQASAEIEKALAMNPDSAQAHFVRGGIYEAQNETSLALADFELASNLAQKSGEDALYVLARTRMAMLLQRAPSGGTGGF
jgi:tetratricopeptide (TPR) repeat protein